MIFRRIKAHIENENWFAVFIDFTIVVVGVFIGIQVANWSELQNDQKAYRSALERLNQEISENIESLDALDPVIEESLKQVHLAISALQSCRDSVENQQAIQTGLNQIRGTFGLHLRRHALDELTSSPNLLALQSNQIRKRLMDTSFYFDLIEKNANFSENFPLEERSYLNPMIGIGERRQKSNSYYGVEFSRNLRSTFLKVSVDQACLDNNLIKSFFSWEGWQGNYPVYIKKIRLELVATQKLLKEL
jgi:hypothetical protein